MHSLTNTFSCQSNHYLDHRKKEKKFIYWSSSHPITFGGLPIYPQTLHIEIIFLLYIAPLFIEPWTFHNTFILWVNHSLRMWAFLNISFSLAVDISLEKEIGNISLEWMKFSSGHKSNPWSGYLDHNPAFLDPGMRGKCRKGKIDDKVSGQNISWHFSAKTRQCWRK